MSQFKASVAIDCLIAHSDSLQESYPDFLLSGHAPTVYFNNFKNDAANDELCDVAFDNLTERIGTRDCMDCDDFPQLPNSCDSLTIYHFNILLLHANFDKLENFLTSISLQPDIIGLSETRIKDEPLINICIPGYRCVHVDSLSNAGGVAAYVSNKLKFETCKPQYQLFKSETLWLNVH